MYTSIVVPLDGSEFGNRALPIALTLAARADASVHLVHVREPSALPENGTPHLRVYADAERRQRTELLDMANGLARHASLRVDADFLDGPVVATLTEYLRAGHHDLVVMMTHGRGGLSRAWLGNVADGLIRHAPVPLLLLRQGIAWLNDAVEPLFRRVLVPLDGSAMADQVLDHVLSLSTQDVTVYVLLTVIADPLPLEYPHAATDASTGHLRSQGQRAAALDYLNRVADELRVNGALVEVRAETHRRAAQGILDAASEQRVDLIALSTHGRGSMSRLLHGSVADEVVRAADVPVLVCAPGPIERALVGAESSVRTTERPDGA